MPALACRAAVHWGDAPRWSIEQINLDPPRPGEVLVRMLAAGLCHTDAELLCGGYRGVDRPVVGGHEGVGVVEGVGALVTTVAPGDHVLFLLPAPPCGRCGACLKGLPHLCERGAERAGGRHINGQDVGAFVQLGLFAEYTVVPEASVLSISPRLSPVAICTVSCAGVTGWGAVQNTAELCAGEVAVVVGVGGVGANAVQAARHLGAAAVLAVDPLAARRELACRLGADDAAADLDAACERVAQWTGGRMADAVIMTAGADVAGGLALLGRRGRLVVIGAHPDEPSAPLPLRDLQESEKQIRGCFAGSWHGREGASLLLDLFAHGRYDPAAVVSRTYPLEHIDRGYEQQAKGEVVRAVLEFSRA